MKPDSLHRQIRCLWVGSVLGVMGEREVSSRLRKIDIQTEIFLPVYARSAICLIRRYAGISEAVVPPTSHFIGRTQADSLRLRKRFGISLLAIQRGKQVFRMTIFANCRYVQAICWCFTASGKIWRIASGIARFCRRDRLPQRCTPTS